MADITIKIITAHDASHEVALKAANEAKRIIDADSPLLPSARVSYHFENEATFEVPRTQPEIDNDNVAAARKAAAAIRSAQSVEAAGGDDTADGVTTSKAAQVEREQLRTVATEAVKTETENHLAEEEPKEKKPHAPRPKATPKSGVAAKKNPPKTPTKAPAKTAAKATAKKTAARAKPAAR